MTEKITITRFDSQFEKQWDEFVNSSNNGTIFHLRRFLNYHPPGRFIDSSLIFQKKNQWLAVFPAAERMIDGKKMLISHPGASYGGWASEKPLTLQNTENIANALVNYAKNHKFDAICITFPPKTYSKSSSDYADFMLHNLGFRYKKREISSVLKLEKTAEQTHKKFSASCLRAVRKAQKHDVEIRKSDDYATYFEILKNNLSARHNVAPTHSLKEMEKLATLFPEKIHLFGAFWKQKMIAGVVMFDASPQVTLAFYISHDQNYQELRQVNLLFHSIVEWAVAKQFKFLDFGIFTVNGEPNRGLAKFKESFGADGIFRDTWEKTL